VPPENRQAAHGARRRRPWVTRERREAGSPLTASSEGTTLPGGDAGRRRSLAGNQAFLRGWRPSTVPATAVPGEWGLPRGGPPRCVQESRFSLEWWCAIDRWDKHSRPGSRMRQDTAIDWRFATRTRTIAGAKRSSTTSAPKVVEDRCKPIYTRDNNASGRPPGPPVPRAMPGPAASRRQARDPGFG